MTSYVASQCIQELLGAFFNNENGVLNGEQEKESIGKPRDANDDPWDGFSYPNFTLMMDSYILYSANSV